MRLDLCSWQDVEGYLQRSTGLVIPIGSHEQHGPNGLIGTDAICPETVARSFGERDDVLIGPTLGVGMAQHHLAFPGTISLRPQTFVAVIRDVVASLARHGFTHLYFLNGHGGNIASVQTAFSEIYADSSFAHEGSSPLNLRCGNWYTGKRVAALTDDLYGRSNGSHATASEVSLTYYAYPQAARSVAMEPKVAPGGRFRDAEDLRRRFPDGRIGSDPSRANAEDGRRLLEAAVEDLREGYRDLLGA